MLALMILHRAKFFASTQSVLALGRAPAGTRGGSPSNIARHGRRACMPKGFARTQSQPSIHSPSPRGRGSGFRQGCRDRTPKGFMQGCIQVVEHGRCRTHRQQTTTIAETQSPQSLLIGIENKHFYWKNILFLQTEDKGNPLPIILSVFIS